MKAQKKARVVVYSFTAVDQLQPLLEEFHKRYPFIKPEHYRANATGVFNKFATEARAGQTLADVIDISAGEAHTLLEMGAWSPISRRAAKASPEILWTRKVLDGALSFRSRTRLQHAAHQARRGAAKLRRAAQRKMERAFLARSRGSGPIRRAVAALGKREGAKLFQRPGQARSQNGFGSHATGQSRRRRRNSHGAVALRLPAAPVER